MVFDWTGMIPRHRVQVMRAQDLRMGVVYARVRTWTGPPVRVDVDNLVFVGTYSGASKHNVIECIRDAGWLNTLCFSLHADGWADHHPKMSFPTAAVWDNGELSSFAFADIMFGLHDVSDNSVRSIVVPRAAWCSNPVVATLPSDTQCPDCKGTGTIMLLTSSVPCGCLVGGA